MLFVNADDFGLSPEVNNAISLAFEKNFINNTTIMANMPGFDHAVTLSKEKGFFDKVGLHINLFEGTPLTEDIKKEPLFFNSDTGMMYSFNFLHKASKVFWFFLPCHTKKAIQKEVTAQINKYLSAGFPEMHCDSHGHSHTFFSVYYAIKKPLKKHGFKTMRKSLSPHKRTNILKKIYKNLYNFMISKSFGSTDYFCNTDSFFEIYNQDTEDCTFEIMTHPVFNKEGKLINHGRDFDFKTIDELENF